MGMKLAAASAGAKKLGMVREEGAKRQTVDGTWLLRVTADGHCATAQAVGIAGGIEAVMKEAGLEVM